MKYLKKAILLVLLPLIFISFAEKKVIWGFYGHKQINRLAVFTLPPEMIGFYKHFVQEIKENAVNPDRRRYAVKNEAPRHYIDLDVYGDSALYKIPRYWKSAVKKYSEDTLLAYGVVPWHINLMKYSLTKAFENKDAAAILRLSADIGHYIADAHVPLHTTENYNGQLTNQLGIHGLWESRLPELFAEDYDFFVGKAKYVDKPQNTAWEIITASHLALDSVLSFEKQLTEKFGQGKKYSYEERGGINTRVYSREFSQAYHKMLNNMVERRMRSSINMVGSFWYTCWVDGGQPDLDLLKNQYDGKNQFDLKKQIQKWRKNKVVKSRDHESE